MKNIYIAGKINGLGVERARANFKKFEETVRSYFRQEGEEVNIVNPIDLIENMNKYRGQRGVPALTDESDRRYIMGICLSAMLCQCDEVHFMGNYKDSEGALLEQLVAEKLQMKIVYYLDLKKQSNE